MMPADTIFHNGRVVTVNPSQPEVEALAIAQGKIIAVGDEKTVMQRRGPGTTVIDLDGKTVMPGFVEAHTHVIQPAFVIDTHLMTYLSSFDVPMNPGTLEQIRGKLTDALPAVPKDGWLLAWGVDPSRSTPFMASLNAEQLDLVSTKIPIFVLNQSGHIAYVNTPAINAAKNDPDNDLSKDPQGGRYERYCKKPTRSEPCLTGVLYESPAYRAFQKQFKTKDFEGLVAKTLPSALVTTYNRFASAGVTTATELGVGSVLGNIDQELALLEYMTTRAETPLRIRAYLDWNLLKDYEGKRDFRPVEEGIDMLSIIGIKFFADGSVQGLSAALKQPYQYQNPAEAKNEGELNYAEGPALEKVSGAAKSYLNDGWQVAFHANGDRATEQVLGIYEQLNPERVKAQRCRIDHFTVVDQDQIKRVGTLGLTPSMTMGHLYYWGYAFGAQKDESGHEPILGSPRAEQMDPAGWLLEAKIPFSFNSDAPISPVEPLRYISTAVTRRWQGRPDPDPDGKKQLGEVLGPDQRIPVDAAIRAVTLDAAWQLFLDKYVGSLEVDKLADLVILDKNPRTTTPEEIAKIPVCATYLSGVCKSGDCPAQSGKATCRTK